MTIKIKNQSSYQIFLSREALYKLDWSEPMVKIAARFGVSSNYMARICNRLNVPRPGRGYWAKKAAKVLNESKEELFEIINRWAEAIRIENFFKDLELKINDLSDKEKMVAQERITLARNMIDSVNALDHLKRWKFPKERIL